jgi:hypothetical protein
MKENINCDIKFLKDETVKFSNNIILKNYKRSNVFDIFKKNIIRRAISNGNNIVKLIFNYEENIEFYITYIESFYLVEVYKINSDNKKIYIETLKFSNRRNSITYMYWFPFY